MKDLDVVEMTVREKQISQEVHSIISRGHRIYPEMLSCEEMRKVEELRSECESGGRHNPEALKKIGWCPVCGYFTAISITPSKPEQI